MNRATQLACAWSGLAYVSVFIAGLAIAGYIPPPSPDADAAAIARMYIDNTNAIRIGCVVVMIAQGFWAAFCAVLTVQLKRVEGRNSPLAYLQLGLAVLVPVEVYAPMCLQEVAAFRPRERSPETLLLLSDMSWMPFVGVWFSVVFQWVATAVVILRDHSEHPIIPR